MSPLEIKDEGIKPYGEVLALQEKLFAENIEAKIKVQSGRNYLVLCQHMPVYTLGKSGKRENILVSDRDLNAEIFQTNRGGDVTFHGPGQLVVYPILDLDTLHLGLAKYIANLEETIILSIANYGLAGERLEGAAGIWIDAKGDNPRKICAIGVKASRHITMHGLAINVNTDLSWFDKIVPCGLENKSVTSMQQELQRKIDMEEFKEIFVLKFLEVFHQDPVPLI